VLRIDKIAPPILKKISFPSGITPLISLFIKSSTLLETSLKVSVTISMSSFLKDVFFSLTEI
jgi:hypothetical protein